MRDLAELKFNEGGERVNRAPPSEDVIAAFERAYGVVLPADYVSLLMHSNGGHPEVDTIAPMGRTDIASTAVSRFFFLTEDRENQGGLWGAVRMMGSILGEKQIPFASDGGGNPFVLDMTTTPPMVWKCIVDERYARRDVASSFTDFIDRLEIDPDMD